MTCKSQTSLDAETTYCVRASPNPEFASNPGNYAHWLLAHLYPLVRNAINVTPSSVGVPLLGARLHIAHGSNGVLPVWAPRYAELLQVNCTRGAAVSRANGATMGPWHEKNCSIHMNVSVPAMSFCRRSWWAPEHLQRFSVFLRARLQLYHAPSLLPLSATQRRRKRIVVLIRRSSDGFRDFRGLDQACEPGFGQNAAQRGALAMGTSVECASFGMSTPLIEMARAVGSPDSLALLSGHGAGLANVIYMEPGTAMAEFDSVRNVGKARNFYQYLASALHVRAAKVWLNASGARFCPPRVNACGANNLNMYRGSVVILASVLDQVLRDVTASGPLRDCGVARDEEGKKMYRAKPRQPEWSKIEMAPWDAR